MNDDVAYVLVDAELRRLLDLPYSELVKLVGSRQFREVVGEDDTAYRIRVDMAWDIPKKKDVRVLVSVDDGSWRALRPLTQGFVVRPDGSFAD